MRRERTILLAVLWFWACTLACTPACTPTGAGRGDAPVETCTRTGVPCIFAPGKLGMCVEQPAPCDGKPCFSCQSQH